MSFSRINSVTHLVACRCLPCDSKTRQSVRLGVGELQPGEATPMGTPSPPHWAHRGPWGLTPTCTPQLTRLEKSQHPRFETSCVFPLEAFRQHWDSQVQDFVPNGFLGQTCGWHWLRLELLPAVPFPTRRPVCSSSVFLTALQRLEREQVSF